MSLNEISYGLAFHPHFATDPPSPPYDSAANLDAIRHMASDLLLIIYRVTLVVIYKLLIQGLYKNYWARK